MMFALFQEVERNSFCCHVQDKIDNEGTRLRNILNEQNLYNNRNMRAQYQCKLKHVPIELANLFDLQLSICQIHNSAGFMGMYNNRKMSLYCFNHLYMSIVKGILVYVPQYCRSRTCQTSAEGIQITINNLSQMAVLDINWKKKLSEREMPFAINLASCSVVKWRQGYSINHTLFNF